MKARQKYLCLNSEEFDLILFYLKEADQESSHQKCKAFLKLALLNFQHEDMDEWLSK